MLALGSGGESLEEGLVHTDRHDLAGAVAQGLATALAELFDWVAGLSLFRPLLNPLVRYLDAIDSFLSHGKIVLRKDAHVLLEVRSAELVCC